MGQTDQKVMHTQHKAWSIERRDLLLMSTLWVLLRLLESTHVCISFSLLRNSYLESWLYLRRYQSVVILIPSLIREVVSKWTYCHLLIFNEFWFVTPTTNTAVTHISWSKIQFLLEFSDDFETCILRMNDFDHFWSYLIISDHFW